MNAAGPRAGWVTVAAAAAALTQAGDDIDPSNVSRYLARFSDIPSEKVGKYRWLDLAALVRHRADNVLVGEKRGARDLDPAQSVAPVGERRSRLVVDADDDLDDAAPTSAIGTANLTLKHLAIRDKELDLAERQGELVKADEVLAMLGGVLEALVSELERQEMLITTDFGREVGAAVRKSRRAAQAHAARRLGELAKIHLPPELALKVMATPADDAQATAA